MEKGYRSHARLNEKRKRLYDRGAMLKNGTRHQLSDEPVEVARDWNTAPAGAPNATDLRRGMQSGDQVSSAGGVAKPRRTYRTFVLIGSFLIFVFVAAISSVYLYFGGNQISNQNIFITIDGPASVGGGEVLPLQVAVTNQNSVPIESATLILKYPVGTRTASDDARNVFEERIPIEDIGPGETLNESIQVRIFGEENAEREINATVEYRVNESNGMFYKDAEPMAVRISSSPLVLRVENIENVASGQLVNVTLTAVSNASTPLENILITADYPTGFDYETADPEPVFGENVWRIRELLPEQTATIVLTGTVSGLTEESFRVNFDAGPASIENQYLVDATLADARADFTIERPFIDMDITINGVEGREAVIPEGEPSEVQITVTNTLDETVYDMAVQVIPSGNALNDRSIRSSQGFYDSNRESVRWEVANNASFDRILPGDSRTLDFTVVPGERRSTASYELVANVFARRVADESALETLIGTERAEARYSSSVLVGSQAGRNVGRFGDSGPVPPQVGEVTTYTLSVVAEAGANDLSDAIVETSLPVYVNWLDQYDAPGEVAYNSVSKQIEWEAGDIPAGERKELTFQVSVQPSVSQLGFAPTLMNQQSIRANDGFTRTLLRDTAPAVTTELSTEMGYEEGNGDVIR